MGGRSKEEAASILMGEQVPYSMPATDYFPGITAQNMAPIQFPAEGMQGQFGQGVNQFLTGQMGVPMQFVVDVPSYERVVFNPGDFANFMRARATEVGERSAAIPVFDPATGTYTAYESKSPKS